jgi:transposase
MSCGLEIGHPDLGVKRSSCYAVIILAVCVALGSQLRALKARILEFDRRIISWHRSSSTSKRLDAIPGVGPALATALVASIADAKAFRSRRDFSAWVGLVPKQNSSGGKDKLGSISKQGDRYLRSLFPAGALAVIQRCQSSWHGASTLTHCIVGAHQGRRHRARQDGLGDVMARNECYEDLPLSRREQDHAGRPGVT